MGDARDNDNGKLFKGLGIEELLAVSFHRSCRVPDHENPTIQTIAKHAPHAASLPCHIVKTQELNTYEEPEDVFLLPLKSKAVFPLVQGPSRSRS